MNHTKLLAKARKWGFAWRKDVETNALVFYHPEMKLKPGFSKPRIMATIQLLDSGESVLRRCVHCNFVFLLNQFQIREAFPQGHCSECWNDLHPREGDYGLSEGCSPFNTPHKLWIPFYGKPYSSTHIVRMH